MNIKSKFRHLLGDSLFKSPLFDSKSIISNKRAIKYILSETGASSETQKRVYLRILATDKNNADQIKNKITANRGELCVESVHLSSRALEYRVSPKEQPIYSNSVMVRIHPHELLRSVVCSNNISIKDEVFEGIKSKSERVVIDYSSPNIAKPFHFGHLKSTILGNFLANINRFLGNEVTRINYIGDWGTQYGLLSLGIDENNDFPSSEEDENPTLRKLLEIYVKANERGRNDENFYKEAKRRFLEMDKEVDSEQYKRWKKIRELSLVELRSSYDRMGIQFDRFEYESDYAGHSIKLVEEMLNKNLARKLEDGVVVTNIQKNDKSFEVPILKSDGASLYLTRDIAAALSRKDKFDFDKLIYVVGADQEKHFHCLREIVKKLDIKWFDQLIHLKMGKVLDMSSRSGKAELLSDIMDEAAKEFRISTINTPTSKVIGEADLDEVSKQLALSALFIYDMRRARSANYRFEWQLAMKRGSMSGINLQATFARLSSLMEKASSAGVTPLNDISEYHFGAVDCEECYKLLSLLEDLDTELHSSYWAMDPCYLTNYALSLCNAVNRARQSEKLWILGEINEKKARSRLSVFKIAHARLETIIKLLGLKPLYKV